MAKRRDRIGAKRIVHPFADLVRRDGTVPGRLAHTGEKTGGVPIDYPVRLRWRSLRIVVAERTAAAALSFVIRVHDHIVEKKDWELSRLDRSSGGQVGDQRLSLSTTSSYENHGIPP